MTASVDRNGFVEMLDAPDAGLQELLDSHVSQFGPFGPATCTVSIFIVFYVQPKATDGALSIFLNFSEKSATDFPEKSEPGFELPFFGLHVRNFPP